jgi:hypothetical protein
VKFTTFIIIKIQASSEVNNFHITVNEVNMKLMRSCSVS